MARARITNTDTGPEVQWGEDGPSFAFERGDDDSLLVALTKAVNVGIESGDKIEGGFEQVIAGVIQKAAGDLAWPPGEGYQELRESVQDQLPKNANGYSDYSVNDVSRDGKKALVCSWMEGKNKYWIVSITLHGSGAEEVVVIPAQSEWVEVEQEYVVAKAGRVLSAKNLRLVQEAAAALAALAEAARREAVTPEPGEEETAKAVEGWDGVEYLILKADKKKDKTMRFSYGPLYAPSRKDAHGEWVEADTLQKALHEFVRESADNGREIHLQHGDKGDVVAGEWVEVTHWPYPHTIVTKDVSGDEHEIEMPEGTVYMGVVWDEDYWDEKAGRPKGIDGLSLGGRAVKVTGGDATMKSMGWKDGTSTTKADPKKPYGDVTYADPGYQEDGKKRYPLDTETHIRAAWSYINQADNAAAYSSDQLSKIKSKVKAAMKRIGADVEESTSKSTEDEEAAIRLGVAKVVAETERDVLRKEVSQGRSVLGRVLDIFQEQAGQRPGDTHIHLPEQNVSITQGDGLEQILESEPKE